MVIKSWKSLFDKVYILYTIKHIFIYGESRGNLC